MRIFSISLIHLLSEQLKYIWPTLARTRSVCIIRSMYCVPLAPAAANATGKRVIVPFTFSTYYSSINKISIRT